MRKRKMRVLGLEECLARLPESERADARKAIEEAFSNPDELTARSKPVEQLPPGSTACPRCNGPLTFWKDSAVEAVRPGHLVRFGDCKACDLPFMVEALS